MTVVIIRDDLLDAFKDESAADARLSAACRENDSLLNTPPVFAIYIVMLVTRWLKNDIGGLAKMPERNAEKAKLLYDVLDASGGFYRGHARPDCRSLMNVTWRLPDEATGSGVRQARPKPTNCTN